MKSKENTLNFLWPVKNGFRGIRNAYKRVTVAHIESKLQSMFPTGYPVLCTSGRVALFIALKESNVSRKDMVGAFPYANHCVLDAIARVATPLMGPTSVSADLRVVYHQWGYVQERSLPANVIEDCVDTLCVPGTALFPGGGSFEIWSLPKILGTTSGGVLWCRDENTANSIRQKRDNGSGSTFQWMLRLLMYRFEKLLDYWQGAESKYRKVSLWQTGEIWSAILQWDAFVADRKNKLQLIWKYAVSGLPQPSDRLPTLVPVSATISEEEAWRLGILHGYRMMEKIGDDGSRSLIRVLPVPIHQSFSIVQLHKTVEQIK
ncbi:MAG: putative PLP-dependent aminotransferase [Bacteroidota bacterium]